MIPKERVRTTFARQQPDRVPLDYLANPGIDRRLKKRYGDRLAFHGCISTAGPVAYGTAEEAVADVRQTLEIMMPGGGYALAPTHQLQDNSPTQNVVAMYDTAKELGCYN